MGTLDENDFEPQEISVEELDDIAGGDGLKRPPQGFHGRLGGSPDNGAKGGWAPK